MQKEWDSLDEAAKLNLQKVYQEKKYLPVDSENVTSGRRSGQRKMSVEQSRGASREKSKTPQKLKILDDVPDPIIQDSDSDAQQNIITKPIADSDSEKA